MKNTSTADRLAQVLAFEHDRATATANDILSLCGPVFGPMDALMHAINGERKRTQAVDAALIEVVRAAEDAIKMHREGYDSQYIVESCEKALAKLERVMKEEE